MTKIPLYLPTIVGIGLTIVACGAAPETGKQPEQVSSAQLTDTSITIGADGTATVSVRTVTPEYRAIQSKYRDKRLVARLQTEMIYKDQPGLPVEVSCDDPDAFWLNTDYSQGGNRICYNGFGSGSLNPIAAGYANNIRSWWAGAESGALHDNAHPFGADCDYNYLCPFSEWQRDDTADATVDDSTACTQNWQCPSGWCLSGFCSCSSNSSCPYSNDSCVEGWCYNLTCGPRANQVNLSAICIE